MSETITYAAVIRRIESSAKDILPDMPKENTQEAWESYQESLETCLDEAHDLAKQEVDSWDWSIYTWQGWAVYDLLSTDERNQAESEWADCGGYETAKEQCQDPYQIGAAIAFFALVNMLTQEIERQCEDLLELCCNQIENL